MANEPMDTKSPEIKAVLETIFPGTKATIKDHKCPMCKQPIGDFKDFKSIKEYRISGMCQSCQDKVFK